MQSQKGALDKFVFKQGSSHGQSSEVDPDIEQPENSIREDINHLSDQDDAPNVAQLKGVSLS